MDIIQRIIQSSASKSSQIIFDLNAYLQEKRPLPSDLSHVRSLASSSPIAAVVLLGHCSLVNNMPAADFVIAADEAFAAASADDLIEIGVVKSAWLEAWRRRRARHGERNEASDADRRDASGRKTLNCANWCVFNPPSPSLLTPLVHSAAVAAICNRVYNW